MVICQALYQASGVGDWKETHDKLKEVLERIGVTQPDKELQA